MKPYFIDIEASSLSWDSYPIEIAWGSSLTDIQSFLISPRHVLGWVDWNIHSEHVHGISRRQLEREGLVPSVVCARTRAALEGQTVYSDNPDFDSMWLTRLFDAEGEPYPAVDLLHIDSLLIETVCPTPERRADGLRKILRLKSIARNAINGIHRAHYDVAYLITLYDMARDA